MSKFYSALALTSFVVGVISLVMGMQIEGTLMIIQGYVIAIYDNTRKPA